MLKMCKVDYYGNRYAITFNFIGKVDDGNDDDEEEEDNYYYDYENNYQ